MGAATLRPAHLNLRGLAVTAVLAAALAVGTAEVSADSYQQAVRSAERALAAPKLSAKSLQGIRQRLLTGTSCTLPEIDSDLATDPPDIADARERLDVLDRALTSAPQPRAGAESKLRSLATSGTYAREQPESPGDLLQGGVQRLESALASAACGGGLAILFLVLKWLGIVAAAIAAAVLLYRLFRRYRHREPAEAHGDREADRLRTAAERFAAADRLSGEGDYAAAIRELAGAVATAIGGEGAWDLSPLTVREIYATAGKLPELRPLLLGFEEAVYGHRPVTSERYAEAARVAARYRPAGKRAA